MGQLIWLFVGVVMCWLHQVDAKVKEDDDYQQALLNISSNINKHLIISYVNQECHKCSLTQLTELNLSRNLQDNVSVTIDTLYPSYYLYVRDRRMIDYCNEFMSKPFKFGEHGEYFLSVTNSSEGHILCSITEVTAPQPLYTPIYISIAVFLSAALLYIIGKRLYKFKFHKNQMNRGNLNGDSSAIQVCASTYLIEEEEVKASLKVTKQNIKKSNRMKSVDVFRGFCLCIMIFVNYGGGGYSFLVNILKFLTMFYR